MRTNGGNDEHKLGLVHLDNATPFAPNREDAKLLLMVTDKLVNNTSISSSFNVQLFYHFGNNVLAAYRFLHDCLTCFNNINRTEPLCIGDFFSNEMENTENGLA